MSSTWTCCRVKALEVSAPYKRETSKETEMRQNQTSPLAIIGTIILVIIALAIVLPLAFFGPGVFFVIYMILSGHPM